MHIFLHNVRCILMKTLDKNIIHHALANATLMEVGAKYNIPTVLDDVVSYTRTLDLVYTNPLRSYHNYSHLVNMLENAENKVYTKELIFAIIFHDFIYAITDEEKTKFFEFTSNEEESAKVAKKFLEAVCASDKTIAIVDFYICATKHPIIQTDFDVTGWLGQKIKHITDTFDLSLYDERAIIDTAKFIHDLDLLSLAQQNEIIFKETQKNVTQEYLNANIPLDEIIIGRQKFFSQMINQKEIFLSSWYNHEPKFADTYLRSNVKKYILTK